MNQRIIATNLLKQSLEKRYQAANKSDSAKSFFLALHTYLRYVHSNPWLEQAVINHVDDARAKAKGHFLELDEALIAEAEANYKLIESYITKNNIQSPGIDEKRADYVRCQQGVLESTATYSQWLKHLVESILYALDELDREKHRKFLSQFGHWHPEGGFLELTYSLYEAQWRQENERIERIKHTEVWYWWDRLDVIYEMITLYDEIQADFNSRHRALSMVGAYMYMQDLQTIFEGKVPRHSLFNPKEYADYLTQLHFEVVTLLDGQTTASPIKPTRVKRPDREYVFHGLGSYSDGLIRYNGEPIEVPYRLIQMARLLLSKPGHLVGFEKFAQELWPKNPALTRNKRQTISKYISDLRKILQAQDSGFKLDSLHEEGWILKKSA